MRAVNGHFRPELINRVDEFIICTRCSASRSFIVKLQAKRR
jgi:ATP-dependent Clp protease ATP-binding subunit ClpA